MGIKVYPVEDGDEDKYEIFTITTKNSWRTRAFQEGKAYLVLDKILKTIQNFHISRKTLNYYDPNDIDMPVY